MEQLLIVYPSTMNHGEYFEENKVEDFSEKLKKYKGGYT